MLEYQALGVGAQVLQGPVHRLHEARWTADVEVLIEIINLLCQKRLVDQALLIARRRIIGTSQDAALAKIMAQLFLANDVGRGFVGADQRLTVEFCPLGPFAQNGNERCYSGTPGYKDTPGP